MHLLTQSHPKRHSYCTALLSLALGAPLSLGSCFPSLILMNPRLVVTVVSVRPRGGNSGEMNSGNRLSKAQFDEYHPFAYEDVFSCVLPVFSPGARTGQGRHKDGW